VCILSAFDPPSKRAEPTFVRAQSQRRSAIVYEREDGTGAFVITSGLGEAIVPVRATAEIPRQTEVLEFLPLPNAE
jgi:hypothetical protein